jgi:hypothetical protein
MRGVVIVGWSNPIFIVNVSAKHTHLAFFASLCFQVSLCLPNLFDCNLQVQFDNVPEARNGHFVFGMLDVVKESLKLGVGRVAFAVDRRKGRNARSGILYRRSRSYLR